jgi:hypothetical protein
VVKEGGRQRGMRASAGLWARCGGKGGRGGREDQQSVGGRVGLEKGGERGKGRGGEGVAHIRARGT